MIKGITNKTDYLGAVASFLCFLHCVATPFIFIAKACTHTCCALTPLWWKSIDYIFLLISFFAIYYAVKESTKKWIKPALWGSWLVLMLVIVNESLSVLSVPEETVYFPALIIVGLHVYNQKYCKCKGSSCCVSE